MTELTVVVYGEIEFVFEFAELFEGMRDECKSMGVWNCCGYYTWIRLYPDLLEYTLS